MFGVKVRVPVSDSVASEDRAGNAEWVLLVTKGVGLDPHVGEAWVFGPFVSSDAPNAEVLVGVQIPGIEEGVAVSEVVFDYGFAVAVKLGREGNHNVHRSVGMSLGHCGGLGFGLGDAPHEDGHELPCGV